MGEIVSAIFIAQLFLFVLNVKSGLRFGREHQLHALLIIFVEGDGWIIRDFIRVALHAIERGAKLTPRTGAALADLLGQNDVAHFERV